VEVNGAITFFNGVVDTTRGHGDGLSIQNRVGTKRIIDVISFGNHGAGMKVSGESGYGTGVHFEGVTSFNNGIASLTATAVDKIENLFVGTAVSPADRITLLANNLYHMPGTVASNATLGFQTLSNGSLVMRDNVIMGGSVALSSKHWQSATVTGNTLYTGGSYGVNTDHSLARVTSPSGVVYNWNSNNYIDGTSGYPFTYNAAVNQFGTGNLTYPDWRKSSGFDSESTYRTGQPTGTLVRVRPNQYERGRAHVAVYNWGHLASVQVDLSSSGLAIGETFEVRDAQNYFGTPVFTGTYTGALVTLPVSNLPIGMPVGQVLFTPIHTAPEFAAFVVLNLTSTEPPLQSPGILLNAYLSPDETSTVSEATSTIQTTLPLVATPIITPPGGTFSGPVDVTLSTATIGAKIRYTLDGSVPGPTSPIYSAPVRVATSAVLRAQAFKTPSGNVKLQWDPNVETDLAGYRISYGSAPRSYTTTIDVGNQTSHQFTGLAEGQTYYFAVRAYNAGGFLSPFSEEVSSGMADSAIAEATFTIQSGAPAAPAISPAGGTFSGPVDVTLSTATAGATIRYTLDGSTPSASSPVYSGPVRVSATAVLKAQSVNSGGASTVTQASFTIQAPAPPVGTPLITPGGGTFSGPINVSLATATAGATIRYTLDGSVPGPTSPIYSAAVRVDRSLVVRAQAFKSGMTDSAISQGTFTIQTPPPAAPVISPNGGTFSGPVDVSLFTFTSGATIRYTLDGSVPGPTSPVYVGPVRVSSSAVLKAQSVNAGGASTVSQATFTIGTPSVATPTITPGGGIFGAPVNVSLSSATTGATIRYTLDGSAPGPTSAVYSLPVRVDRSLIFRAQAFKSGMTDSAIAQASFTIETGATPVATPAFTPPGGTFVAPITVTLSSATAGATIRYTMDGSVPGPTSPIYSGPIAVSRSLPLRAQAIKSGMPDSAIAQANYTIQNPAVPDSIAPAVSIISPLANTLVTGVVNITASTWDNVKVVGVQFYINGVPIGAEDTVAPFTAQWDTRVNVGTDITAVARDAAGHATTSAKVTVRVGN
jgi:hypothetical protein